MSDFFRKITSKLEIEKIYTYLRHYKLQLVYFLPKFLSHGSRAGSNADCGVVIVAPQQS